MLFSTKIDFRKMPVLVEMYRKNPLATLRTISYFKNIPRERYTISTLWVLGNEVQEYMPVHSMTNREIFTQIKAYQSLFNREVFGRILQRMLLTEQEFDVQSLKAKVIFKHFEYNKVIP